MTPPVHLVPAIAGERVAIQRLLADCRPDLSRYARRHCESEDVEDAVQDALVIIARRLSTLRGLSAFAGWTFKIVKHICLRMARSARLAPLADHEWTTPATQELRVAVAQGLSRLPEGQREAVILKDIVGLTAEEMAREVGLPLEAAKARLHRGRLAIRQDLDASAPRSVSETHLGVR